MFETEEELEEATGRMNRFVQDILMHVYKYKYFFVATDNLKQFGEYVEVVESKGGIVINKHHLDHRSTLGDFFMLSRCKIILQNKKYSMFSIAAALVNSATLVNFHRFAGNAMDQFEPVLKLVHYRGNLTNIDYESQR